MPRRARPGRARDAHLAAGHLDAAAEVAQDAEEREQEVALALAVEAAEADDLAAADVEGDVAQAVGPGEAAAGEDGLGQLGAGGARREDVAVLAADHHLDHLLVGFGAGGVGRDVAAVAEDGAFVGQRLDLVHAVRDVDQRQALGAEALQHGEDLLDVGGGQGRGGLVEDEDARALGERLGDLDHLPAGERQVLDQRERVDVGGAGAGERLLGEAALGAAVDHAEAGGRPADDDVVGDREVGDERELLEDADDAGVAGGGGRGEGDGAAVEGHGAVVGLHHAGHDLDEGGLAGAVLAEDGVDAARADGELGVGQRHDAAVALGHAVHAEERLVGHGVHPAARGRGRLAAAPRRSTCRPASAP